MYSLVLMAMLSLHPHPAPRHLPPLGCCCGNPPRSRPADAPRPYFFRSLLYRRRL